MSRAEKRAMMAEVLNAIASEEIISPKVVEFVFLWWEDLEYGIFLTVGFL